jgi:hypothetical protein
MAFRSEREALKHRVDSLERELEDARSASAADLERREQEIAQLREQLQGLPPDRDAARRTFSIFVSSAVLVLVGAALYFVMRANPEPAPPPAPMPVETPAPPPAEAVPPERPAVAAAPPPVEGARLQPSRDEIQAAFAAMRPALQRCARGTTGVARATVSFSGETGRPTTVEVAGEGFAGRPAGACITRELRALRLEPFGNPSLSVTYPFMFH